MPVGLFDVANKQGWVCYPAGYVSIRFDVVLLFAGGSYSRGPLSLSAPSSSDSSTGTESDKLMFSDTKPPSQDGLHLTMQVKPWIRNMWHTGESKHGVSGQHTVGLVS